MEKQVKGLGAAAAVLLLAGCTATQAAEPAAPEASVERTISTRLEQDPGVQQHFLSGLAVTGEFRCGVGVLDVERDGTTWLTVVCGDFRGGAMVRGGTDTARVEPEDVRFPHRLPTALRGASVPVVPSQAELAGF